MKTLRRILSVMVVFALCMCFIPEVNSKVSAAGVITTLTGLTDAIDDFNTNGCADGVMEITVSGTIVIDELLTIGKYGVTSINDNHTFKIKGINNAALIRGIDGNIITSEYCYLVLEDVIIDGNGTSFNNGNAESLILVNGTSALTLNTGAVVQNNRAGYGDGSGIYVDGGKLTINGGEVKNNSANGSGGGIYLYGGEFVFNSGKINNNLAGHQGGGVYIEKGEFKMYSGEISGNFSGDNGGGVYANMPTSASQSATTLYLFGGSITGNSTFGNGGGLYLSNDSSTLGVTCNVGGALVIADNTNDSDEPSNLYITDYNYLIFGSMNYYPQNGMCVWITLAPGLNCFATDNDGALYTQYFFSDKDDEASIFNTNVDELTFDSGYKIIFDKNGGTTQANPRAAQALTGGSCTLPTTNPTKTGYTFSGWNTSSDGSGTSITSLADISSTTTLYAQWTGDNNNNNNNNKNNNNYPPSSISSLGFDVSKIGSDWNSDTFFVYDGTPKEPKVAVYSKTGSKLVLNKDYTVEYLNNIDVGTATIIVTGIDKYENTDIKELNFRIIKANQIIKASNKTKTIKTKSFNLNAILKYGDGTLKYQSTNKDVCTISKDGRITVKGIGTAVIRITSSATKNFNSNAKEITITITPKQTIINKAASKSEGKLTVIWKTDNKASGYEVQLSTVKDFSENVKSYDAKKKSSDTVTFKNLSSGKKYYARVRTYTIIDGEKIYGEWSDIKTAVIK